jgi:uncharacterized protein (TIGR00297 family)
MIEAFIVISIIILGGFAGYLVRSLTSSGAVAAILVGIAVFLGFGVSGLLLLGVFFSSSTYWSNYKSSAKNEMEDRLEKGAKRDWRQVVANGGTGALFSILYYFEPSIILLVGFTVSLASANSDTWASEIGSLSKKNPIYIRTLRRVEKGTSGAVSLLGSTAALLGSLLIAGVSFMLFPLNIYHLLIIFLFGFIGNIVDTVFGAFYQKVYTCNQCGIETEKKNHCQKPTVRIKGLRLVDNDMVNFLSGLIAALLAIAYIQLAM